MPDITREFISTIRAMNSGCDDQAGGPVITDEPRVLRRSVMRMAIHDVSIGKFSISLENSVVKALIVTDAIVYL